MTAHFCHAEQLSSQYWGKTRASRAIAYVEFPTPNPAPRGGEFFLRRAKSGVIVH